MGTGAVGYAVRGDARQSPANSLLVCTAGVLLRRLEEEPDLTSFDVVLVDEVRHHIYIFTIYICGTIYTYLHIWDSGQPMFPGYHP